MKCKPVMAAIGMLALVALVIVVMALTIIGAAHAATFNGDPCQTAGARKLSVAISDSASGETQLIAGVAGEQIYVCSYPFDLSGTSPTAEFDEGTGTACGTGTTALTGAFTTGKQPSAGATQLTAADGQSLCLKLAGTSPVAAGAIVYVQQ